VVNYPSYSYTQFNEDFESQFLCNNTSDCEATNCNLSGKWDNLANLVNDDIDWRVNSGSTPSSNTGPSTDYNPGTSSGKYIYTEASSSCNFKRAILQSSCIDLSGAQLPALKFAYHMYGLDMGSMQVNVISPDTFATVFSVVDDQGNFWFPETINLNDFLNQTIQIQFVGVTGDFYRSDIALDDISISDLTTIEEINTVSSVKMYPNPANDELTISSNKKINNILITDVSGKVVESYKPSSNQITLSVKNLAVGVYFITIKGEEVNETKRLIIQK